MIISMPQKHNDFGGNDDENTENKYLPHNLRKNSVVYTGTHDNQTTQAWFESLTDDFREEILLYTKTSGKDIVGDFMKLAWESEANMAIIPLQDLLRLGSDSRMNIPGTSSNNWEWRFTWNQEMGKRGLELSELTKHSNR